MSAPVTLRGRLVRDPEMRTAGNGNIIASFSIATNERIRDKTTGEWSNGDATFWDCSAFGNLAQNVIETLRQGMQAVVVGKASQREYTTGDGAKKRAWQVTAEDVAVSLQWVTAKIDSNEAPAAFQRAKEEAPF